MIVDSHRVKSRGIRVLFEQVDSVDYRNSQLAHDLCQVIVPQVALDLTRNHFGINRQ